MYLVMTSSEKSVDPKLLTMDLEEAQQRFLELCVIYGAEQEWADDLLDDGFFISPDRVIAYLDLTNTEGYDTLPL